MQIHLLDISSCDGKTIQESVIPELEKIDFQMGSFPVLAKEPVELTITNTGDKVLELTGTGKITVGIPCDRCLETVAVEMPLEFKKKLDMKLSDEERVNDLDESSYLTVNLRRCNLCPFVLRTNLPKLDVTREERTGK